jgi:Zn-dependent peptidase ImmA (M78 family)
MKVFHSHGSKERLFEIMKRVNNINEQLLPVEKKNEIINDFVKYVDEKLGLGGDVPKVEISYDEGEAQNMKSFGKYTPETNILKVVIVNRNLADVLRTIGHELVHRKQDKEGNITPNSGETGSNEENEANALAGSLMREFGKNNPIIFE